MNQWVGSGAARTYGDDTRQYSRRNGRGIWLYKRSFRHRILRFTSTEATTESCSYLARQVRSTRSVSQGTEVTIVTEYVPYRYSTHTASCKDKGHPVTKQRLSKWIVDAVMLAYSSLGLQCPIGVRAHSTRGIASSWAWSSGVSITEICMAAGWATPSTFARFYNLDIPALQARVLSA